LVVPVKALVTGAAGFIGRHMVRGLRARRWDVTACDIKAGWDALSLFHTDRVIFDLVVHCAYRVGGRAAIEGQPANLIANLTLDTAMFEWAVRTGQRRVLYYSSSAAYPINLQHGPPRLLVESDINLDQVSQPDANYGWAKLTGEQLARVAVEQGLTVHVVRPFSGYGRDQDLTYPFPTFVARAVRREDPFIVWGDGTQVRDWVHIDDVVGASLAVVDNDLRDPVNICTGHGISMRTLIELVTDKVGYHPRIEANPEAPTGVAYRVGDPKQMLTIYQPKITIEEAVRGEP
jgi:nucleoside-diphosphate-sugar epimerase